MPSFALPILLPLLPGLSAALSLPPHISAHTKRSEYGPALSLNFPDPCMLNVNGEWWAFGTNGEGVNIPIAKTGWKRFEEDWKLITHKNGSLVDALPTVPAWVSQTGPNTWAPDVSQLDDGTFVMYYSAAVATDPSKHCVGAAISPTITGPYVGTESPLFCPLDQGGAIDASGFKDWSEKGTGWGPGPYYAGNVQIPADSDAVLTMSPETNSWTNPLYSQGGKGGKRYVVYKVDGAAIGHGGVCGNEVAPIIPTPLVLQEVAADGYTLIGGNTTLLDNRGMLDMGVTEAPSLLKTSEGKYILFYSRNCYNTPNYTVSYATSNHIKGPFHRQADLFHTGVDGLNGPGGPDIHWDGVHMVFHANDGDGFTGTRLLHTAELVINGNQVIA